MNRAAMDKWCERGILYLALGIMIFGPLATGAVRTLEFLIIQDMALGVMVLWGLRLWINPKPQILWTPLCWAIVVFVLYAIGRYLTSDIEYVARGELVHILVYGFLFFAVLNNLHRQESTQIISFTMIGLAVAISGYAVYQYVTNSDKVWYFIKPPGYKDRAGGTYINPNNLAGFLELLIPLGVAYTLVGRARPLTRVLLGYAVFVMAAGMGVTVSRGGWVSCGVALVLLMGVMLLHHNFRLQAVLFLAVLAVGCAVFFVTAKPFEKRFTTSADATETTPMTRSFKSRYELWQAAIRMWRDHVWFGVGPGLYDYRFRVYRPLEIQVRPDRAHNEYLDTLADWGVVGAASVAAALVTLGAGTVKTWKFVRRTENEFGKSYSNKFAFVLGAAAGLLALLLHSFTDFNLQIPANAILATSLMALLNSHLRFASDRYWVKLRLPGKTCLSATLAVGLAFLGWQECRRAGEYACLERARKLPAFSPEKAAALEKASSAEPENFDTTYEIAEAYRTESFDGGDNYAELAKKALDWYARGMKLDPYDGYNYMGYGMCLDWLGRQSESGPYFNRADELDPNGYYVAAHVGWHYVQLGDYAAARIWFRRSELLEPEGNDIADSYMEVVESRLLKAATNTDSLVPP
jgi:O-antigen ligase